ncbi:MAG TPA: HAD family phosphatase [bacterium]|nr:HAD family phosphatase [bacterium]
MNVSIEPHRVRAVVFDLGGVFFYGGGPEAVLNFGARHGLAPEAWHAIRQELFVSGDLWGAVERAEMTLDGFAQELISRVAAHGVSLSLDQARGFMDAESAGVRHEIMAICERLRALMPTALLTNNIREWRARWRRRVPVERLFDLVVDSSEVGVRKPELPIYQLVEQGLGLSGPDLLFVDDLGVNLKAARSLGWQTVKYDDTAKVLAVLEQVAQGRPPRQPPPG